MSTVSSGGVTPQEPEITEEMIAAGAQAMRDEGFVDWDDDTVPTFVVATSDPGVGRIDTWVPPEQVARAVLAAALASRTEVPAQPVVDWTVVEQAVHRATVDYARAYFIPANGLCAGVPEYQRRMAENWAQVLAPHAVACIREDLRKAAVGLASESRKDQADA